jgi:hypothetical protein
VWFGCHPCLLCYRLRVISSWYRPYVISSWYRPRVISSWYHLHTISPSCDFVVISPSCDFVVISHSCDFIVISPSCDSIVISPSCNFFVISPSCNFVVISSSCDFVVSLCVFRVSLFLSEIFCASPFVFLGCLFFHRMSFAWAPLHFLGAYFFIANLFCEPLCVFEVRLFSSKDFCVRQWTRGFNNAPLFKAPMFCVKRLSNFQLTLLAVSTMLWLEVFFGTKLCWSFRVDKLWLIKNLTPLWASPVRKRVWALRNKCAMLALLQRLVYSSRDLCLQFSLQYKNDKGFLHSMNVLGLSLGCLIICRRTTSFSPLPRRVLSTLLRIFLCSLCEGFTKAPDF